MFQKLRWPGINSSKRTGLIHLLARYANLQDNSNSLADCVRRTDIADLNQFSTLLPLKSKVGAELANRLSSTPFSHIAAVPKRNLELPPDFPTDTRN